jgi:hypothetical protein
LGLCNISGPIPIATPIDPSGPFYRLIAKYSVETLVSWQLSDADFSWLIDSINVRRGFHFGKSIQRSFQKSSLLPYRITQISQRYHLRICFREFHFPG